MTFSQNNLSKGNILIVDDTPDNLRLLSTMLIQQGYDVRSAISGSAALMTVRIAAPDLILLDVNMPIMNGYEVCQQLKANAHSRHIPIIFLSALSESIDKVKAFQAGGVDYITKPFQVEEVLVRVEGQMRLQQLQIELQQAKADALKTLAQEQELSRLKSEFIRMVFHDFCAPLVSIQELLKLVHADAPEVKKTYLDKINLVVEHLLLLLDQIVLLGGSDLDTLPCQPERLNLEQFCWDLLDTLHPIASDRASIAFTFSGDLSQVELDPSLLRPIINNLLSNARKYSPAGTPIQFDVSCQDHAITLCIQDNGIGIPAASQPYLLDAFYRCQNVGSIPGTGLGLAVVKRCVDAHHGQILFTSTEGVGTTVTVILPRSPFI
jgi:signal transduction histidine kinase